LLLDGSTILRQRIDRVADQANGGKDQGRSQK
jgi:hypothetical protein